MVHEVQSTDAQLYDYERTSGEFRFVRQFWNERIVNVVGGMILGPVQLRLRHPAEGGIASDDEESLILMLVPDQALSPAEDLQTLAKVSPVRGVDA